ncbi:hypothetical protein [Legionella saoudiensis]|uniref:hypothetical protein n=1 Tax=Legionella saoudiensis TaxID=1750561 RepID=UPI00072FCC33|nr:hypothetical protein [Legionella saoudiensis]
MSQFSFTSTLIHDNQSQEVVVSVTHRLHKKSTQRRLNQDSRFGSLFITAIQAGDTALSFASLNIEDQIRLRHESWDYLIAHHSVSAASF